ncbi:10516_t:CDS:1, partial [Entrophospora sp. SA101]
IISHVRPTAESESGDELSIVSQRITTKEALESLNIVPSYIQDPPENLTFEFKHINSIKAIKNHISKHTASKKNKAHRI